MHTDEESFVIVMQMTLVFENAEFHDTAYVEACFQKRADLHKNLGLST